MTCLSKNAPSGTLESAFSHMIVFAKSLMTSASRVLVYSKRRIFIHKISNINQNQLASTSL